MIATIDKNSGYCFGVEFAIQMAEDQLAESHSLYCLGDIVHNRMEVERLNALGLVVIDHAQLDTLHNCKVLIRAHGEPASTYATAIKNNIELIDASCPVVLKLQNRVKNAFDSVTKEDGQILIFGQKGHAEVIGLTGQTGNQAKVITTEEDLDDIDYSKPTELFSQTTKSTASFYKIKESLEARFKAANPDKDSVLDTNDSICRQVSNREPQLEIFSQQHNVILFVSGKKSSNGKALYQVCKKFNQRSYFIESPSDLDRSWFADEDTIGICGATSTPMWLMQQVKDAVNSFNQVSEVS